MLGLTLRQLRIFVAVADQESLAGAGRLLRLSQATVSEALRDLEAVIGQVLFDRTGRKLKLSVEGRALLPDARQLLRETEAVYRRHSGRKRLALAASVTAGNYVLPPLIAALTRQDPDLDISVTIRNTEAVVRLMLERDVEVAIVEGRVAHPHLDVRPWRRDELAIVVRPGHALAADANVEALAQAPWVLREQGSGTRESFDAAAASWPQAPRIVLTVGGNELLKAAVAEGVGVGCLSRAAVAAELARGELVEVQTGQPSIARMLSLVVRTGAPLGRQAAQFIALCDAWSASSDRAC
jgi:DNA-binding transcriptional LysR family regulator